MKRATRNHTLFGTKDEHKVSFVNQFQFRPASQSNNNRTSSAIPRLMNVQYFKRKKLEQGKGKKRSRLKTQNLFLVRSLFSKKSIPEGLTLILDQPLEKSLNHEEIAKNKQKLKKRKF